MQRRGPATSPGEAGVWRATLAGLCAILVGVGLARFAYTPLIPALIAAGWFAPAAAGVGLGIAASGTLVPLLLRAGLSATWCGLGALAVVLTILAWRGWPAAPSTAATASARQGQRRSRFRPALRALYVEYALTAVALVPHMVFLVDFVARGLERGIDVGSQYWVLFGAGAVAGPLLAGQVADRIGFARALRLAFVVQAGAVGLPAVTVGAGALALSSLVVGAMVPGIVALVLGRVHELSAHDDQERQAAWSVATAAFALGQAAAYGFSFLFARSGGGYAVLFALGTSALMLALGIDLAAALFDRRSGG